MGCTAVRLLAAAAVLAAVLAVALGREGAPARQSKIVRGAQNALASVHKRFPAQGRVAGPSPSEGYAIFGAATGCEDIDYDCGSVSGEWNVSFYRRFISPSVLAITFTTVNTSQEIQFISGGAPTPFIYLILYDEPDTMFLGIADFDYQPLSSFALPVTNILAEEISIFNTVHASSHLIKGENDMRTLFLTVGSILGGEPCSSFVIDSGTRYTFTVYISADNGHLL